MTTFLSHEHVKFLYTSQTIGPHSIVYSDTSFKDMIFPITILKLKTAIRICLIHVRITGNILGWGIRMNSIDGEVEMDVSWCWDEGCRVRQHREEERMLGKWTEGERLDIKGKSEQSGIFHTPNMYSYVPFVAPSFSVFLINTHQNWLTCLGKWKFCYSMRSENFA